MSFLYSVRIVLTASSYHKIINWFFFFHIWDEKVMFLQLYTLNTRTLGHCSAMIFEKIWEIIFKQNDKVTKNPLHSGHF